MVFVQSGIGFWIAVALYLTAVPAALLLHKSPRTANLITQFLCMAAAVSGFAASLLHLLLAPGRTVLADFTGTVPLLAMRIVLDDLSAFFLLTLSVLVFAVSLFSISYLEAYAGKRNLPLFDVLYALFVLSMVFVFTSGHAVFFLTAWEAMSILSYFLVVFESEREDNVRAGTLYLVMTTIGTAFLLTAFLLMYAYTGSFSMDASDASAALPQAVRNVMFLLFLVGFGLKAGVVPLHVWLPHAHPAAPANVSALMSGIMVKTGIYGLIRFVLVYLGVTDSWWGAVLLVLGLLSALTGVSHAYVENDVKRILAYSTIENVGIILSGLGVGFLALANGQTAVASVAIAASLFHTLNHALFKGSLFLGIGSVHHATHTRNLEQMGGLIHRMPGTALLVLGGSLAISGLVPFNGFASEWLTFQALFQSFLSGGSGYDILFVLAVAALALSGALAAATFLRFFGVAFLGKPRHARSAEAMEAPLPQRIGSGILVALCLALGLSPALFLRLSDAPVASLTGVSPSSLATGWFRLDAGGAASAATANSASISPLVVFLALAALALAALGVVRLVGGRYLERRYGTWDCGYEKLDARMQFSATGFSKPFRIVFRFLFRPTRELKVEGEHPYHPDSMEYTVRSESLIELYLYDPVVKFAHDLSNRAKASVQTGSIRRYLSYILFALVAALVYFMVA
jgi:formate hydrogenlyase subunit 3/multisubunit Na+/H+ antiporter MnhD subunit